MLLFPNEDRSKKVKIKPGVLSIVKQLAEKESKQLYIKVSPDDYVEMMVTRLAEVTDGISIEPPVAEPAAQVPPPAPAKKVKKAKGLTISEGASVAKEENRVYDPVTVDSNVIAAQLKGNL